MLFHKKKSDSSEQLIPDAVKDKDMTAEEQSLSSLPRICGKKIIKHDSGDSSEKNRNKFMKITISVSLKQLKISV